MTHATSLAHLAARAALRVLEAVFARFAALVDRAANKPPPDGAWIDSEPKREDW